MMYMPLLEVNNMSISFKMYEKGLRQHDMNAISNISLDVDRGEIVAIVGSSGSGKSLFAHGIMGILPKNATMEGEIIFDGEKLTKKRQKSLRGRRISLVPQSISYLDPLMRIGRQVQGPNRDDKSKRKLKESFKRYNLCKNSERLYPFQLSGGMARRAMVSIVDQEDSDLIIADEPTPGLDLDLAMKTLRYFREFADRGKAVILITHDIDLALNVADRIAIFYAGTIVEVAPVEDFHRGIDFLKHPYTKALFNALPQNEFKPFKGNQPYGGIIGKGCLFAPRCNMMDEGCKEDIPIIYLEGKMVRCKNVT
ncbi:MAG TPA: ABC transporter ATP-binding protein [Tepidimicrobium sp.]|nr:ABC transporter ATP-binding protein [Tepidimicrobium sp.]